MASESLQQLYPFSSHYVTHGQIRQHYLDEGEGPPILMLHGNPTWSFFYRNVILQLRDSCRCIVPDHVGCGFSDKPQEYSYTLATHIKNLEALVEEAKIDQPMDLIVHDWGGAIGMGYATAHPERIRRIVILNTAAWFSTRVPLRIQICRIPVFGALAVRGLNGFAGCATFMTTVKPLPSEIKAGFLAPYDSWANRIAVHRFVQDIPMHEGVESYALIRSIEEKLPLLKDKPMLIQWGEKDWCFDMTYYQGWRERFPEAEAHSYPQAGHYLLEDAGAEITGAIQSFLAP